jgi:hypothetical protein
MIARPTPDTTFEGFEAKLKEYISHFSTKPYNLRSLPELDIWWGDHFAPSAGLSAGSPGFGGAFLTRRLLLIYLQFLGRLSHQGGSATGLPNFSGHNIPKRGKIYQIKTKLPNRHKIC